jgi:hypothetical protein
MDQAPGEQAGSQAPAATAGAWLARAPDAVTLVALLASVPLLLIQFLAAFAVPGRGPMGFAAWVEDDFFYYVVGARNILHLGVSTYDGVTLTNGYHPLWMVVCVGVAALFDTQSQAFFLTIFLIQVALVVWGVVAFASLMRKAREAGAVSVGGAMMATSLYGVFGAVTAAQGMEVALLWPLMPLLLQALWRLVDKPDVAQASIATALLSAVVMSRLDSVVVFAPACLGVLALIVTRRGLKPTLTLALALIGLAPILAYLIWSKLVFGAFTPVSGLAKRLMIDGAGFGPSATALASFIDMSSPRFLLTPMLASALSVAGLVAALMIRRQRASVAGAGFLLVGLGALLFYAQAVFTSDWALWHWYFYALALTGALAGGVLFDIVVGFIERGPAQLQPVGRWLGVALSALLLLSALKLDAYELRRPPGATNALFLRAIPIADFAKTHPGRYAMGDGAGAVGFLLPQSLVQLEGLMNDRAMMEDIRSQGRVIDSLRRQKADYYIYTLRPGDGRCVALREPAQAGPRAPSMSQTVCKPPVFADTTGWISTVIWDVRDGLD